jgi:16S rRNA (uracil1498-N3)-methyltransferase
MHRFRASVPELAAGRVRLRGAELRHLRDVLRLAPGARIEVFDGEGRAALAVVAAVDRRAADLTIVAPIERNAESPLTITLAVGLAKGAKLDWIVEKTTELGVSRIVPFTSERAVPERMSFAAKLERWRRIASSAAAQSGRAVCPEVENVSTFDALLARRAAHDRALFFWEEATDAMRPVGEAAHASVPARAAPTVLRNVMMVTGPEGGFSKDEAAAAARAGFTIASLGPRTLRAETAAVTVVVLAQIAWGDLLMPPSAW